MSLERILAEEAELEKQMFGTTPEESASTHPEENIEPGDSFVDEDNQSSTDFPDATSVIQQEQQEEEAEVKQRVSWKTRFKNYKASTDRTISTLRKDNNDLIIRLSNADEQIHQLSSKINTLMNSNTDIFSGVITEEDSDTIGEEAVDILKRTSQKAVEASVAPLKEEINKLKAEKVAEMRKAAETKRQEKYNTFLYDLRKFVPDFQVIDKDPGFANYMQGFDSTTGEKRVDVFHRAEEYLDAERVADFFTEYKRSIPKSKREVLEENITPTSTPGSGNSIENPKPQEIFSAKQVEDFFNDVARGVYRNRKKEADDIEARITRAYMDGRIR